MARVEGNSVIIEITWPEVKQQIDSRSLNFRFEENSTAYEIFAIDGQYIYTTIIYKSGQAPENQATYDTWRTEFETDYKNKITDFNSTQPFFLTNVDGYSVVLKDGASPTANDGYGVAVIGYDGSNYRLLKSDTSGRPILVGAGTAGSPVGGIITIQGNVSGTPIPISGNITASNASVSDNDAAIPLFSNLIGGSDGTNLRPVRVFDVDSGGGQQWVLGVGLRKASGGGSVELGTSSDPIRIDTTGTTTQPISGTITANAGSGTFTVGGTVTANAGTGNFTVVQSTASNLRAQLASESSTGAAITSTAVMVGGSDGTNLRSIFVDTSGRTIIVGAAANGAAVAGNPILIAGSDGTNARSIKTASDGTVRIDPTGTTIQPVSGTITANAGSGTFTVSGTVTANIGTSGSLALDATLAKLTIAQSTALGSNTQAMVGGSVTTAAPTYTTGQINPLSLTTTGALRTDSSGTTQPVSGTVTANIGTSGSLALDASITAQSLVDNAGFTDGTTRIQPVGYIFDETAGTALTENDAAAARIDSKRSQIGVIEDATTRGTRATVKAASTAAVATDTALVVAISPNNSIAVTVAANGYGGQIEGRAADGATPVGNPVLIGGYDGTHVQTVSTDNQGRIIIAPSGASSTLSGFADGNIVLATTTTTAVYKTTYTEQITNAQRSLVSSSAADASAGTGARTVKITYYTDTMTGPFNETVTLNGTTPVNTVATNICFIEKLQVITSGSGLVNAGTISLKAATAGGGATIWTISIGDNQTFGAHHYVTTGLSCYVTGFFCGIKGADTTGFILRKDDPTTSNSAELQISDLLRVPSSGQSARNYGTPIAVVGPSRITAFALPDSTSSRTYYASFDFYDQ